MNRRSFLRSIGIGVAAASVDPEAIERLLWTPTKTIFIPAPRNEFLTVGLITRETLEILRREIQFLDYVVRRDFGRSDLRIGSTIQVRRPIIAVNCVGS